ncbi:MAG: hypothetical protein QM495_02745 [Lutibacter sp.]|uniref:hypothetical protein n=1 Tax=Lutibacter sp. TaxID=1925666 RepID=UPI00385F8BF5
MARAMFEYTKAILEKVSFNKELFKKELEKAVNRLLPYEIKELYFWLIEFTVNKPDLHSCLVLVKN